MASIQDRVWLVGILLVVPALAGCAATGGEGAVTTYVKDAASDDFQEVQITFDEVEVHFAGNETWVTTVTESRTVDLLSFDESASKAFLGEANLSEGRYTQIRIHVTDAYGIDNNGDRVDITVTQPTAKTAGTFEVVEGETTQVTIDVDLDQSLHEQGPQGWRLTPVIGRIDVRQSVQNDPRADRADSDAGGGGGGTTDGGTGSQTTYVKDRPGQNFSEVWVRFDEVQVHFAGNDSWITVFDGNRALDLLEFNETGSKAFLGEADLSAGRYTQIRLNVTDAWGINHTGGNHSFDLVKTTYKLPGTWNVTANSTTQVVIDINLSRALHPKGGGGSGPGGQGGGGGQGWQFTPVIGKIIVTEGIDNDPKGDVPDQAQA